SAIIPESRIRSSSSTNLGDLLKTSNLAGIWDYGPGALSSASIRGSSSEQVLILVDGKRINDSRSGMVDLQNVSITNAKRIEIIRGGQSAMYGADAVGGIINIITKQPDKSQAQLWSTLGAFNSAAWGFDASKGFKAISGLISFSQTSSESNFPFEDKYGEKMTRENAETYTRTLSGKIRWNVFHDAILKLSSEHNYSDRGDPGPIGQYTPEANKLDKANGIRTDFEHSIKPGFMYKLMLHKRYTTLRYVNPLGLYPADDTHKTDNMGAEFQAYIFQNTSIPLISGISLANDDIESTALGNQIRKTYSAYIQQELRKNLERKIPYLNEIGAFPAIRWDHYSDFEAGISPKIGFLASFGKDRIASVKGNIGRSYRAPTLNELYWPSDAFAVGNPELKPERSNNADIGLNLRISELSFFPRISIIRLSSSFFTNSFNNRIQWSPGANGKWSPQNLSKASSRGIETETWINLSFWNFPELIQVGGNYVYLKTQDALDRQFIYRPQHSGGYIFRVGSGEIWCQLQGIYQSRRYYTIQNTKWLEPFMKHDLQLGLGKGVWKFDNVGIILEIKNLFDKKYQLMADYPLPGREWSVKTTISMEGE
ncbi:TonB-dependent receptor, partial [Candidatus Poribacteria bacterium]|nr:TonB-dependent receptor [Candidatus Poribacteria bacterium]